MKMEGFESMTNGGLILTLRELAVRGKLSRYITLAGLVNCKQ